MNFECKSPQIEGKNIDLFVKGQSYLEGIPEGLQPQAAGQALSAVSRIAKDPIACRIIRERQKWTLITDLVDTPTPY